MHAFSLPRDLGWVSVWGSGVGRAVVARTGGAGVWRLLGTLEHVTQPLAKYSPRSYSGQHLAWSSSRDTAGRAARSLSSGMGCG